MKPIKGRVVIDGWDNGGVTADRYSIAISGMMAVPDRTIPSRMIPYTYFLFSSSSPYHPQGVGMYGGAMTTAAYKLRRGGWRHMGKRIDFMDLPPDVRRFVAGEFMPETAAAVAPTLLAACVTALSQLTEDREEYRTADIEQLRAAINMARGK